MSSVKRPVNWLNGMNINQSHFVEEQKSFLSYQMLMLQNQITPFNYGVFVHGNDHQLWIGINNNSEINVELNYMTVLFPGGYLLEIEGRDENLNVFHATLPKNDMFEEYAVVLSVNTNERIPYGEPDENEVPIRKPYVVPDVNLSVVSIDRLKEAGHGDHFILIGRLLYADDVWMVDDTFVPPAQRIVAVSSLVKQHHVFENHLSSIERSSIEIIQKIRQKKQDNELATILLDISIKLNDFLGDVITDFKSYGINRVPLDLFTPFMKIARLIQNVLDTWQGCGKDEMLTYLADWCDISQGEFENLIQDMIEHKYRHDDIFSSVRVTTRFADVISTMFTVLASLDYIGKKIETSLFVAEENEKLVVEEAGTTKKKRKFKLLRS